MNTSPETLPGLPLQCLGLGAVTKRPVITLQANLLPNPGKHPERKKKKKKNGALPNIPFAGYYFSILGDE